MCEFLLKFKWWRRLQEKQFLPTKEDIESKEVKQLARRLKGNSDSETLNNILEWQDKNIVYWPERAIMEIPSWFLFPIFLFILGFVSIIPIVFIYFLLANLIGSFLSMLILIILVFVLGVFLFKQQRIVKLLYIITFSIPLYTILNLYLTRFYNLNSNLIKTILDLSIINWIIFGISLFIFFYLSFLYWPFFRSTSFLDKIKKVIAIINNQFSTSLTTPKILEYKLAICRDYAKLTASLLLNIYPKNKIYFITIPGHVASIIEINNKMYVLDQRMPISSLETWLKRWKKKKAILLRITKSDNKLKTEFCKTVTLKDQGKIKKVLDKMVKKLEYAINNKKEKFEFVLKDYSSLYNLKDEIIKESLIRTIWNKIESEFLSKSKRIKNIEISQNGKDLILKVLLNNRR